MDKIVTLPGTLPGLLAMYSPVVYFRGRSFNNGNRAAGAIVRPVDDDGGWHVEGSFGGVYTADELELNLSTPEGMCRATRWLATQLGMDPGVTAPLWIREPYAEEWIWVLQSPHPGQCYHMRQFGSPSAHKENRYIMSVPGINDMIDPAESLAAACIKVGGTL